MMDLPRIRQLLLPAFIAVSLWVSPVMARDWLMLAGAEASKDAGYIYAGVMAPIKDTGFGTGFMQRYWLDWLTYQYDNSDDNITARAPGAAASIGYNHSHTRGYNTGWVGIAYRNTSLSPDDKGADARGAQWGIKFQVESDYHLDDRWLAAGIASFTTSTQGYWVRGRLLRRLHARFRVGPEAIFQGGPDYSSQKYGIAAIGIQLDEKTDMGLKGGVEVSDDNGSSGYIGIEFGRWWR